MADNEQTAVDEYDAKHGKPESHKDKDNGLTPASNKPAPAPTPFRNLKSE
jgi:hypothetical protein